MVSFYPFPSIAPKSLFAAKEIFPITDKYNRNKAFKSYEPIHTNIRAFQLGEGFDGKHLAEYIQIQKTDSLCPRRIRKLETHPKQRRNEGKMTDMTPMLRSMEDAMKLQIRAKAEQRAEKAAREKKEFQEKLMRASANKIELDGIATRVKGADDAVRRDQLMGMLMAGF